MKYGDLKTGDIVTLAGSRGVVMAIEKPHPTQTGFWLIVWYLMDEKRLSFDCLSPVFELIPGSKVHNDGFHTWNWVASQLDGPM